MQIRHNAAAAPLTKSSTPSRHRATCVLSKSAASASGSSGAPRPESGPRSRSDGSRRFGRSSTDSTRRSCTRNRSTSESIDLATYSRQRDKLREELTLSKIDHHTEAVDELDVEGILAFAERILPRASDLWVQASLDYKQRLQQLFFPEGIAFDGNRFSRTAVTAPLFSTWGLVKRRTKIWRPQCQPVGTGSFHGCAKSTGFVRRRERLPARSETLTVST